MAICSCDEGTDKVGMSLTSSNDNINVTTQDFNVLTESFVPDSVYTYNNELYLGRITDPETGITVASSFMTQFNMMENTLMPNEEAYHLIIANVNHLKSPSDAKVRDTVLQIVDEFFSANNSTTVWSYLTCTPIMI